MLNVDCDVRSAVFIPTFLAMVFQCSEELYFVFDFLLICKHQDIVGDVLLELHHVFEVGIEQLVLQKPLMDSLVSVDAPISHQNDCDVELIDICNVLKCQTKQNQ